MVAHFDGLLAGLEVALLHCELLRAECEPVFLLLKHPRNQLLFVLAEILVRIYEFFGKLFALFLLLGVDS